MKVGELVGTLTPLMQEHSTIYVYCGKEVLFVGFYKPLFSRDDKDKKVKSWRWTEHHGSSYLEIEVEE
jgi:hypothetical protein